MDKDSVKYWRIFQAVRFGGCYSSTIIILWDFWDFAPEFADEEDSYRGVSTHIVVSK